MSHVGVDLIAPPTIAQSDGHRAFGGILSNNVLVQLVDDLSRCHV
jgi:hypothetical protein